jgi:hypothetical protein
MSGVGLYGRPPRCPCLCLPTLSLVKAMWPALATIKVLPSPRRSTALAPTGEPREKKPFLNRRDACVRGLISRSRVC